jgi:acetoacetyl-CoA synthetase
MASLSGDLSAQNKNEIMWEASSEELEASLLWAFKNSLEKKYFIKFKSYNDLHSWSVKYYQGFWRDWLLASKIVFSGNPDLIYTPNPLFPLYGGQWFSDLKLNYAENMLSHLADTPLRSFYEKNELIAELKKDELIGAVKFFQEFFKEKGLQAGDVVAAFVGNNHLALISMLACASLGAVWTSCSPDFGEQGVLDRFQQVKAKFFLYDEQSVYGGKRIDLLPKVEKIQKGLQVEDRSFSLRKIWEAYQKAPHKKASIHEMTFERVSFMSPLYILFSSGTTGVPKCIVHSVGGVLLQHTKELLLHSNIKKGERFFYYTTTGWMMWNWMLSALFAGAELYTLEGSPLVDDWNLWTFVDQQKIKAFGTSARFIATCRMREMKPKISTPRITFSTGSPLLPEDFDYYYSAIDPEHRSQLASISGGTDIVSCFMLGNPWKPVRRGEIQGAGLAMDIAAVDERRKVVVNQEGELVCRTPFPCMPIYFLNDSEHQKINEAYFNKYLGFWHHGDYVTFTGEGGVVVHGRSDTTLNPNGVRIGTAEIYRIVEQDSQIADSLVVGKEVAGNEKVILFLKLKEGGLTDALKSRLKAALKEKASPRHVPDYIFEVKEIPYTLSGKKVELAVKKLLRGEKPQNLEALQNPKVLADFEAFKGIVEKG